MLSYTMRTLNFVSHPHGTCKTSPPQSNLGRARRYPHVGECTVPLRVLAVACTVRMEALRIVTGRYGTLRNRYGKCRFCPSLIEF